jgi:hypothetical protein
VVKAIAIAVAVVVTVFLVTVVVAQIRYIDKDGVTHWVQHPDQVPPEYREKVEMPRLPSMGGSGSGGPSVKQNGPEGPYRPSPECNSHRYWVNDYARKQWQQFGVQIDVDSMMRSNYPSCFYWFR